MQNPRRGSAQVVEISFVLPVAMLIVLSLVYLAFAMFLYVHVNNIALFYVDELSERIGEEGPYWQLLGDYISDESLQEIQGDMKKQLKACTILPGLRFDSSCSVYGKYHCPIANVNINATYFGNQIFNISVKKDVYKPHEFACTVDFGYSLVDDFEELKSIYDKFF